MSTRPKKRFPTGFRSERRAVQQRNRPEGDDLVQVVVLGSLSMAPSFACWSTSAAAVLGLGYF